MVDVRPRPQDLAVAPELAALVVLETAIDMAIRSLIAAYPDLDNPETPYWVIDDTPTRAIAETILIQAGQFLEPLAAYRKAIDQLNQEPDVSLEIPF